MQYTVSYLDETTRCSVAVDAADEETAIFLAGMRISEWDLNPDHIQVTGVRNDSEARFAL